MPNCLNMVTRNCVRYRTHPTAIDYLCQQPLEWQKRNTQGSLNPMSKIKRRAVRFVFCLLWSIWADRLTCAIVVNANIELL